MVSFPPNYVHVVNQFVYTPFDPFKMVKMPDSVGSETAPHLNLASAMLHSESCTAVSTGGGKLTRWMVRILTFKVKFIPVLKLLISDMIVNCLETDMRKNGVV